MDLADIPEWNTTEIRRRMFEANDPARNRRANYDRVPSVMGNTRVIGTQNYVKAEEQQAPISSQAVIPRQTPISRQATVARPAPTAKPVPARMLRCKKVIVGGQGNATSINNSPVIEPHLNIIPSRTRGGQSEELPPKQPTKLNYSVSKATVVAPTVSDKPATSAVGSSTDSSSDAQSSLKSISTGNRRTKRNKRKAEAQTMNFLILAGLILGLICSKALDGVLKLLSALREQLQQLKKRIFDEADLLNIWQQKQSCTKKLFGAVLYIILMGLRCFIMLVDACFRAPLQNVPQPLSQAVQTMSTNAKDSI